MLPDFPAMTGGHIFLAILFPAVAAVSFYAAWRGLRGTHRRWVFLQHLYSPAGSSGAFNNWPFRAASGGVLALALCAETLLKYTDYAEVAAGPQLIAVGALPFLGAVLGNVWWPGFLAPRWYRQWHGSGHKGRDLPFTQQEIARAKVMPDGLKKEHLLREIQRCRDTLSALQALDQRLRRKV